MNKYRLSEQIRPVELTLNGQHLRLRLRQIIACRDFADVRAGDSGGWVDSDTCLSQHGTSWIYDQNSLIFNGASIRDNARILGPCQIYNGATVTDSCCIENSEIGDRAQISHQAGIHYSRVRGACQIRDNARVLNGSHIQAVAGLTASDCQQLRVADQATVSASRVVHQAQVCGHAIVNHGFIEHRARIFDHAIIDGNVRNNVWVCDSAQVYGRARIVAGNGEDEIPTLRYSTRVYDSALVIGNCVLCHHVQICGHATLNGGPLQLDNHVVVCGYARITGNVFIEGDVQIGESACVEAFDGDSLHLQGSKIIAGEQHITRSSFPGVY